jgi:hypothetical protein
MANENNTLTVPVVANEDACAIPALGILVTWKAGGEAQQQECENVFASVGFGNDAPKPRTIRDSLHAGLVSEFSRKNRPVRPTPRGYEVVQETPTEDGKNLTREHVVAAWIERDRAAGSEVVRVDNAAHFDAVKAATDAAQKRVDGTSIGKALSTVAGSRLGGFSIRDGGGVYWVPPAAAETWAKLAQGLTKTGVVRFRQFTVTGDAETVDSLVDSVEAKIEAVLSEIVADLDGGKVKTARGLTARSEEAAALVEQLGQWETVLGRALDSFRTKVEEVQVRAAQAALAALSADSESEAA